MTYDIELHVSIPSIDEIRTETEFDILLEAGTTEKAEGRIRSLTRKARNYLFLNKSEETKKVISYLIFKGTWENMWKQYVISYIEATFYYGDESNWATVPIPILTAIQGTALNVREFTGSILHEVRYTTEVF